MSDWRTEAPPTWGAVVVPPRQAVDPLAPFRPLVERALARLDPDQTRAVSTIRDPAGVNVRGAAVAGSGKCVGGDTLIPTPAGLLRIDQAQGTAATITIDTATGGMHLAACQWLDMDVAPVLEIETAQGIRLTMTPEHPLLVWNEGFHWVEARNLQVGDHVLLVPGYGRDVGERSRDPEEAYLAGLFMGDGGCYTATCTSWSRGGEDLPPEFLSRATRFWTPDFAGKVRCYRNKGSVDWRFSGRALVERLHADELAFGSARDKRVPSWVLRGTADIQRAFLQGLWDTDGTATGDRAVEWVSASETLARECLQLLLALGVVGTLRPRRVKGYDHTYWRILLSGAQAAAFQAHVGFRFAKDKCRDLARMVAKPRNPNIGCYPHVRGLLQQVREEWKAQGTWDGRNQRLYRHGEAIYAHHYVMGIRAPSREKLTQLIDDCVGAAAQTLRAVLPFFPDPIVSIRPGTAPVRVYDLHVPGTHSFVANGIVSHNTTLLVASVAALVVLDGVSPEDLIVTTFTRKAAQELTKRLGALMPADVLGRMRVGTFHSLALRAVADADPGGNWSPTRCTDIGDSVPKSLWIWESIIGWRKDGVIGSGAPSLDIDKAPEARDYALAADVLRSRGLLPTSKKVREHLRDIALPEFLAAWKLFEEAKQALGAFDFADALSAFLDMLADGRIRERPRFVLVDEFQDNSWVQGEIIRELGRAGRVVLLGDRKQAIYAWRGGSTELFDDAETRYAPCVTVGLRYNYRSGAAIIEAGNRMAQALGDKARVGGDALVGRPDKHSEIRCVAGEDALGEANAVAEFLRDQHAAGRKWSDMAVLVRTNSRAGVFEGAFQSARVPVVRLGGRPFFERDDVLTFLSYAVLGEQDSWPAFERIVNRPKRFLARAFVEGVGDAMKDGADLLTAIDRAGKGKKGAQELSRFIRRLRATAPWPGRLGQVTDLLMRALPAVEDADPTDDRRAVPQTCREIGLRFGSAVDLCAYADAAVKNAMSTKDDRRLPDRVLLSSIHRMKGLQAPVVVVSIPEGVLPHHKSPRDEELCLAYVAVTRAEELLVLSWPEASMGADKAVGASEVLDIVLPGERVRREGL